MKAHRRDSVRPGSSTGSLLSSSSTLASAKTASSAACTRTLVSAVLEQNHASTAGSRPTLDRPTLDRVAPHRCCQHCTARAGQVKPFTQNASCNLAQASGQVGRAGHLCDAAPQHQTQAEAKERCCVASCSQPARPHILQAGPWLLSTATTCCFAPMWSFELPCKASGELTCDCSAAYCPTLPYLSAPTAASNPAKFLLLKETSAGRTLLPSESGILSPSGKHAPRGESCQRPCSICASLPTLQP